MIWWAPLLAAVAGVLFGWGISEWRDRKVRERKRNGCFESLAAEIQICSAMSSGYLKGNVMAPAYRMPLMAYENALPPLLAEGVLTYAQMEALTLFYVNVQAFNFALDQPSQC